MLRIAKKDQKHDKILLFFIFLLIGIDSTNLSCWYQIQIIISDFVFCSYEMNKLL